MPIPNVLQFIEEHVIGEPESRRPALINILADIFYYESGTDWQRGCCHEAQDIRAGLCPGTPLDEIPALQHMAELWT